SHSAASRYCVLFSQNRQSAAPKRSTLSRRPSSSSPKSAARKFGSSCSERSRDAQEKLVVATTKRRRVREVPQLFNGELPDRREHEKASALVMPHQALVDE